MHELYVEMAHVISRPSYELFTLSSYLLWLWMLEADKAASQTDAVFQSQGPWMSMWTQSTTHYPSWHVWDVSCRKQILLP